MIRTVLQYEEYKPGFLGVRTNVRIKRTKTYNVRTNVRTKRTKTYNVRTNERTKRTKTVPTNVQNV